MKFLLLVTAAVFLWFIGIVSVSMAMSEPLLLILTLIVVVAVGRHVFRRIE